MTRREQVSSKIASLAVGKFAMESDMDVRQQVHRGVITIPEAARVLGLKEATIRAWILRRKISYCKIGSKSVRIPTSEIDRILQENVVPALGGSR
jgi:excisionase family DNA binding protein